MTNVKKNLYQKLIEVRKSVPYIKKGAEGFGYTYTKESQIIGAISSKMNEEGIWLDLDMIDLKDTSISIYNSKAKSFDIVDGVQATFEFTITNADDPQDKIIKRQILQDSGSDVKTIGGLETYANKYFMLKFFLIPNDNLDPDQFEKSVEKATNKQLSEFQINEMKALLNGNITAWEMLKSKFGYSKVSEISQAKYEEVKKTLKLFNLQSEGAIKNEDI